MRDPNLDFKIHLYQNQPNYFNDDELDLLKQQMEQMFGQAVFLLLLMLPYWNLPDI